MVKASAGGGGNLYVQKFVEELRHIEIRVLGDAHSNTVYLWERERSIRCRQQRVSDGWPLPRRHDTQSNGRAGDGAVERR